MLPQVTDYTAKPPISYSYNNGIAMQQISSCIVQVMLVKVGKLKHITMDGKTEQLHENTIFASLSQNIFRHS